MAESLSAEAQLYGIRLFGFHMNIGNGGNQPLPTTREGLGLSCENALYLSRIVWLYPHPVSLMKNLREMVQMDYRANRKNLKPLKIRLLHLDPLFARYRATDISTDAATRYILERQEEGASNASINSELSVLGRMFTLAIRQNKVASRT